MHTQKYFSEKKMQIFFLQKPYFFYFIFKTKKNQAKKIVE